MLLLWFENIKGHPAFILFRCLNTVGGTPRALACVALKAVHDLCHISSSSPPPHHFLCLHNLCCTPSKSRRRAAINSQQLCVLMAVNEDVWFQLLMLFGENVFCHNISPPCCCREGANEIYIPCQ